MSRRAVIRFGGLFIVVGITFYLGIYNRLTQTQRAYLESELQNTSDGRLYFLDQDSIDPDSPFDVEVVTEAPQTSMELNEVSAVPVHEEVSEAVGGSLDQESPESFPLTLNYSNLFDPSSSAQFPPANLQKPNTTPSSRQRMNVLFVVVDDLRPQVNAYKQFPNLFPDSDFAMHTPNIDSLARRSLLLSRAYVQYSSCNPSRASYMTSRRPDTTKVWDLYTFWRKSGGNFTTIPEFFGARGYKTTGMGKIFHPGPGGGLNDPQSWNDGYYIAPHGGYWSQKSTTADFWKAVTREQRQENPLPDEELTIQAVKRLRQYAPKALTGQQPFFLALGYLKPHLPIVFPEEFLALYPLDNLSMPTNIYLPRDFPEKVWTPPNEVINCADVNYTQSRAMNVPFPREATRILRRAYFAGVSYVDFLLGVVLSELDALGLADSTIVSFLGDHGWHLGELGYWGKHTNFDLGLHSPLMMHVPGRTDDGLVSDSIVEFTDIFPTIVEAAGFGGLQRCPPLSKHVRLCTEGTSFLKLIDDPAAKIRSFASSQHRLRSTDMGYTIRTERYRYTETVRLKHQRLENGLYQFRVQWDSPLGVELYDHQADPQENVNIAGHSKYTKVVAKLSSTLRKHFLSTVTDLIKPFSGTDSTDP